MKNMNEESKQSDLRILQQQVSDFEGRLRETLGRLKNLESSLESELIDKSKEELKDWDFGNPENRIQHIQKNIEYADHLVELMNKSLLYLEGVLE